MSVSFHRAPEPGEKPKCVVSSRSRPRQSHFACRFVEIQTSTMPLCVPFRRGQGMQLYRNPNLGEATRPVVALGSRSRQSHFACGCIEIQIAAS